MMECQRLTVKEAAEILGVGEQLIRIQLQRKKGEFSKIGFAEKSSSGKSWRYYIYKEKLLSMVL